MDSQTLFLSMNSWSSGRKTQRHTSSKALLCGGSTSIIRTYSDTMQTTRGIWRRGKIKDVWRGPWKWWVPSCSSVPRICWRLCSSALQALTAVLVVSRTCPWRFHILILRRDKTSHRARRQGSSALRPLLPVQSSVLLLLGSLCSCLGQLQHLWPRERKEYSKESSRPARVLHTKWFTCLLWTAQGASFRDCTNCRVQSQLPAASSCLRNLPGSDEQIERARSAGGPDVEDSRSEVVLWYDPREFHVQDGLVHESLVDTSPSQCCA